MAGPQELTEDMKNWMVFHGYATRQQVDAEGTDSFKRLNLFTRAVAIQMYHASIKDRDLRYQQQQLAVTAKEIETNNLAMSNWDTRGRIAEAKWPVSEADQEALALMLDEDVRLGLARIPDAPGTDPLTKWPIPRNPRDRAVIENAKTHAEAILDQIGAYTDMHGAAEPTTWPTYPKLQESLTEWLKASGVPVDSISPEELRVDGIKIPDRDPTILRTDWPVPTAPAVLQYFPPSFSDPDGQKYLVLPDGLGGSQLHPATVLGSDKRSAEALFLAGVEMLFVPPGTTGRINGTYWQDEVSGKTYFVPSGGAVDGLDNPLPFPDAVPIGGLVPAPVGASTAAGNYFFDGTDYYKVNYSLLTDSNWVNANHDAVWSEYQQGTPWEAFVGHGLTLVGSRETMVDPPTAQERGAWNDHFDKRADDLESRSMDWKSYVELQKSQMQLYLGDYQTACNMAAAMVQRNEQTLSRLAGNIGR